MKIKKIFNIKLIILFCVILSCATKVCTANTKDYRFAVNYLKTLDPKKQKKLNITQNYLIIINTKSQKLCLYNPIGILLKSYTISTSKKGLGQLIGSRKTPVGLHQVVEKIGDKVPHYGVFRKRKFINYIWPKSLYKTKFHKKDFIVTRILRLKGLEPGINAGYDNYGQMIDSFNRTIYIHGTTMEWKLGVPSTIGCIHLSSKDIVDLFNITPVNSLVMIY